MRIGETFTRNNRTYKVIDILPKHKQELDMFVCIDTKTGYKQCYQRQDFLKEERPSRKGQAFETETWTADELMQIQKMIKDGLKVNQVEALPNRTLGATKYKFTELRKKMYYSGEITKEEFLNTYTGMYKGGFIGE